MLAIVIANYEKFSSMVKEFQVRKNEKDKNACGETLLTSSAALIF